MNKLLFLLLLCSAAFGQTATISAHLQDPTTGTVSSRTFLRFELKNTGGNQCRVGGTALITPYIKDFTPNGSGVISGTIYQNSAITCGNQTGNTQWAFTIWRDGKPQPSCFTQITTTPINLDSVTCSNTTPVVSPPTGDATYCRIDGSNCGFTGNITANQHNVTGIGSFTAKNLEGCRYTDQFAGADLGAQINAASTDAGTNGCVIVPPAPPNPGLTISTNLSLATGTSLYFPPGVFLVSAGTTIANAGVKIHGAGSGSTIFEFAAATGNMFTITGQGFEISGVQVRPHAGVTRTAGAFMVINAVLGRTVDISLVDPFIGFDMRSGLADNWYWSVTRTATSGGNWNALFLFGNITSGTQASSHVEGVAGSIVGATVSGPMIVIDSGVDSLSLHGVNIVTTTFPAVQCQNTNTATRPRWVRITNSYFEAGTSANAVAISDCEDVSFWNSYFASSLNGVSITGGRGLRFGSCVFENNQNQGFLLGGGVNPTSVLITDSDFSDNSQASAGGFFHISVSANVNDFRILGNRFGNHILSSATKAAGGISISAGTSDNYQVIGNFTDPTQITTFTPFLDAGTGTHKKFFGNIPEFTGLPQVNLVTQGAAIAATNLYAVPATDVGHFRVCFDAKITRAATTSATLGGTNGFQLVYTDSDDSVSVTTPAGVPFNSTAALLATNTTQNQYSGCLVVNVKASTTIQYKMDYTSSGATTMQYSLHIKVEAL